MARFFAVLMCTAAIAAGSAAAGEVAVDETALANLVTHDCGSCHGLTLKGGLGLPLTAEALAAVDREALAFIILHGVPKTAMPGWRGLITEADADWIADALKEGRFQ